MRAIHVLLFAAGAAAGLTPLSAFAGAPAKAPPREMDDLRGYYVAGVKGVNTVHAQKPGTVMELELARRLPAPARAALDKLIQMKDSPDLFERLIACGEAALDLDLMGDFVKVRSRLEKASPEHAARLGTAFSRPRFILRGLDGLDDAYLAGFADVLDAVLDSYDQTFGFKEWSKVPGKKLRVKIHRKEQITREDAPHFAPQFPFHSEIDFTVIDPQAFRSPTPAGQFLFYGLCHELGHVIAMWGDFRHEEDHHAWAHYTGLVIVERLSESAKDRPFMKDLRDAHWPRQSLTAEKKRLEGRPPSLSDREGVLALLFALHDQVGPKVLGEAMNLLDRQDKRLRMNRVRYYTFKELEDALLATLKAPEAKKAAAAIIPDPAKKPEKKQGKK